MKKSLLLFTVALGFLILFLAASFVSDTVEKVDSQTDRLVQAAKNQESIEIDLCTPGEINITTNETTNSQNCSNS